MGNAMTRKFKGTVLPDGHLSLPDDAAIEVGKIYDVTLVPAEASEIYEYTAALSKEKGFKKLSIEDVEKIIHESRGLR
jgi:hypothetical protein